MADCLILLERCQRAVENRDYAFNWTLFFARRWQPDMRFPVTEAVRPTVLALQNGCEYLSDGGQTNGLKEPKWAKLVEVEGAEYTDGSITWIAQELSYASLADRLDVADVQWSIPDDSGISQSDAIVFDEPGLQMTQASFTGGTAGETYDIVVTVTTIGGKVYTGILRLTIED